MKKVLFAVAALLLTVSTASADVRVTMKDGRVTLVAKDATVRQILTEWARVGQTKIVNVERIPGPPITIELTNVPEAQALDILLRTLSGYITAPRPVIASNLSLYDRIIVMPTLASARPAISAPPPPVFQQQPQQFAPPQVADDDQDDQRPAPNVAAPGAPARGPVFNSFPQPQAVNPGAPATPPPQGAPQQAAPPQTGPVASPTPVAPYGGVSVPGMIAPPPPNAPGQPVKRPGGL